MHGSSQEYHRRTSYDRHAMQGHFLDWQNQPSAFKSYPGLQTINLPEPSARAEPSLSALASEKTAPEIGSEITMERLARLLVLSHAVTASARHGGAVFHFRSVASAGALYPFELYVATGGILGLPDGLYHHDVSSQRLTLLRSGNAMQEVSAAVSAGEGRVPIVAFLLTSIFFRSSWKYRDRAYRYNLLDTGHLLENLTLALRSERLPFEICYDFDDERLNKLLGVDTDREVCLALVKVWGAAAPGGVQRPLARTTSDLIAASRVAAVDVAYPAIRALHQLSAHVVDLEIGTLDVQPCLGLQPQGEIRIPDVQRWPEQLGYFESVMKRRSMRNFVNRELPADCFAAMLKMLCSNELPGTSGDRSRGEPLSVGFVAGNVEGLDSGLYLLDRRNESYGLVSKRVATQYMAEVCLNQAWLANCAIHILFLTNLGVLEDAFGPRGYRYAMLEAGRLGQRMYVTAASMRLGCCGIGAFYDDEAAHLLGLNDRSVLLYLVAAGPVKKWTVT